MKKYIIYINHNLKYIFVNQRYIFIGKIRIKNYRDYPHYNMHNVASHSNTLGVAKSYCIEFTEYLERHQIQFCIY